MKIAILVGDITSTGGIERALSRVSDILIKAGYEVTIISLFKANDNVTYYFNPSVKFIFLSDKKYATSKQGGFKRLMMFVRMMFKSRIFFKSIKNKYNLFIGCGFPINTTLFFSGLAPKAIATEHTFYNYYPEWIINLRTHIYRHFSAVTALTEKDTSLFREKGINCYRIPNPLTFKSDTFSNLSSKKIISVGRLSPEKGFEDLIDIMPGIIKKYPEWSLHIFGEGYLRPILETRINELGLQNKVYLRGNTKQIQKEYLDASLFVLSSKYEGFAIVILEAAACGLPIISYDCPNGPGEILNHDKGILVSPGNKQELQKQILNMIENPSKLQQYANKGEAILAPYAEDVICEMWQQLITRSTIRQ